MKISAAHESWPIAGTFAIARGSKTAADVIVVTVEAEGLTGRGEAVPYKRYGESVPAALAALESIRTRVERGLRRQDIAALQLPKSAANALDCALWDIEAKAAGKSVWQLAGLASPKPVTTAFTLSLDTPANMAAQASRESHRPLLKLKLGAQNDAARLELVRKAAPKASLVVDANEGWTPDNLGSMLKACAGAGVLLVEQPLPQSQDEILRGMPRPVRICADESAHGLDTLPDLAGKYDAINIKLDKTGGLTPALELATAAQAHGLAIMVGCMLATSLAMAPALLLAAQAEFVDLDGPLLLQRDRQSGLTYEGSTIHPAPPELWG